MLKRKSVKIGLMLLCAALLCAGSVMGTMAYFTAQETVTNTFTVGKVVMSMDESKVSEYGVKDATAQRVAGNAYKLIPGHTYAKDPVLHVEANSEACWLFVKVDNQIAGALADPSVDSQLIANHWKRLDGVSNVYYMQQAAVDQDTDVATFDHFIVKTSITGDQLNNYQGKNVNVTAYAIQLDGFENSPANAWNAVSGAN